MDCVASVCGCWINNRITIYYKTMGARRNIALKYTQGQKIYFYTHWGAEELEETLRKALSRGKDRWGDESYLARIIFSEMIKDEVMETTGYGIAPYECDPEYTTIEVDLENKTVDGKLFEDFVR
ncbi:MAG: hypothetical protein AB9866_18820 [Syntrophobacteraceae bacterium]